MLRKNKGQSTVEYAIIIGVIVAALIGMQTYLKRGLQARYRDGITFLSRETGDIGVTNQYEPYYLDSDYTTSRNRTLNDNVLSRGDTTRAIQGQEVIRRNQGGSEQYNLNAVEDVPIN